MIEKLLVGILLAATPPSDSPVLTNSAKDKVKAVLKTVDSNIAQATRNVDAAIHNVAILESEQKELGNLLQETSSLKKDYESLLSKNEERNQDNELALKRLEEQEKKTTETPKGEALGNSLLVSILEERKERLKAQKRFEESRAKLVKTLTELEKNEREIQSRLLPLRNDIKNWNGRADQYKKLRDGFQAKKASLEKKI